MRVDMQFCSRNLYLPLLDFNMYFGLQTKKPKKKRKNQKERNVQRNAAAHATHSLKLVRGLKKRKFVRKRSCHIQRGDVLKTSNSMDRYGNCSHKSQYFRMRFFSSAAKNCLFHFLLLWLVHVVAVTTAVVIA